MPGDLKSRPKFRYVYGPLIDVIHGRGRGLSNANYASQALAGVRSEAHLPVLGVFQPFYLQNDQMSARLGEAVQKTSQEIIETAFGALDAMPCFLTAVIYDSSNELGQIREAIPESLIERVAFYSLREIPNFANKGSFTINTDARVLAINGGLQSHEEEYLRARADSLFETGAEYGMTLPEYIILDLIRPNSALLSPSIPDLGMQKAKLNLLFLLLEGKDAEESNPSSTPDKPGQNNPMLA